MESMYSLPYAGESNNSTDIIDCWVYKPVTALSATPLAICPGESISVSDLTTNIPTSWQWNFQGGTPANSSLQNTSVTYNSSGVFDVTLIASNQMGSDTLVMPAYVTVHPNPVLSLSNDSLSICRGDTVSVVASGASTYYWFSTPTTIYSVGNTLTATPLSDAVYELLGSSFGCVSDTARVVVHVDSLLSPSLNISVSPDTIVCSGTVVSFNSVSLNEGINPFYQWKVNGTSVGQDSSAFSTYTLSSYSVSCVLTSSLTCANPLSTLSNAIHISISQLLNPQITSVDSALSSSSATSYQWYLNGQAINGANTQDYVAAAQWYRVAAEAGNVEAQVGCGRCLHFGLGVEQNPAEARRRYLTAIKGGAVAAYVLLGLLYFQGLGVPKDSKVAAKNFRCAAERGLPEGQYYLGWCFSEGEGVRRDDRQAVLWLTKSAESGYPEAMTALGAMHVKGRAGPTNCVAASP